MRILLTGGTGLIGRALCRHWTRQGHELLVWSRHPDKVARLCGPAVRSIASLTAAGDLELDAVINLAGNVVMFVPLGALLPAANGKLRKFFRTFFACAGLILVVEVLQLFTLLGSFDVDDIILNLSGMLVGFILFAIFGKKK